MGIGELNIFRLIKNMENVQRILRGWNMKWDKGSLNPLTGNGKCTRLLLLLIDKYIEKCAISKRIPCFRFKCFVKMFLIEVFGRENHSSTEVALTLFEEIPRREV